MHRALLIVSSLILIATALDVRSLRRENVQKRQATTPCTIPLQDIALGTEFTYTASYYTDYCASYRLKLTSLAQDVLFQVLNSTEDSYYSPTINMVYGQDYNASISDSDSWNWDAYPDSPLLLPACTLPEDKVIYLVFRSYSSATYNMTFSVTGVTAAPIKQIGTAKSYSGIASETSVDVLKVDPISMGKSVFLNVVDNSSNVYINVNFATCGTPMSGSTVTNRTLRSEYPNTSWYITVLSRGGNTSYGLEFTQTPVVCSVPNNVPALCPAIDWPSAPVDPEELSDLALIVGFSSLLGPACAPTLTQLYCGAIFAKCDANNYPEPPCLSDCQKINADCPATFGGSGLNCSAIRDSPIEQFCYLNAGVSVQFSAVLVLLACLSLTFF